MKTIINYNEMKKHYEDVLAVCKKEIEYQTNPQKYGCCLSCCNSIVINKERMLAVTTKDHETHYEFSPTYPTYFTPDAARRIANNAVYTDCDGNRINLEIIGKLEYYKLLKAYAEKNLKVIKTYFTL